MAAFCGAWALKGGPVEESLSEADRRSMLARLPASCSAGQVTRGPLWLAAPPDALAADPRCVLACAGTPFFSGQGGLSSLVPRSGDRPGRGPGLAGSYALVRAFPSERSLSLSSGPLPGGTLYYARCGDILVFSSSMRALWGHPGIPRAVDRDAAWECVLGGGVLFGGATLAAGVSCVPTGRTMTLEPGGEEPRQTEDLVAGMLDEPWEPPSLGRIRKALRDAVSMTLGPDRRTAVLVSGGVDSAVVAALAVERLGASNVRAFTYEFAGSTSQIPETEQAARTCRHLGIAHEVVPITCGEYLDNMPEFLWRSEDFTPVRHGLALAILSKRARDHGFTRVLSGLGMDTLFGEPHFRDLDDLGRALAAVPMPGAVARTWLSAFCRRPSVQDLLGFLHPGLRMPTIRLWHFILCVLRHNGVIGPVADWYPAMMSGPVTRITESERVRAEVRAHRHRPLAVQLQAAGLSFFNSYYAAHRAHKGLQEGLRLEMPTLLARCLMPWPYAMGRVPGRSQPEKHWFMKSLDDLLPRDIRSRPKVPQNGLFESWRPAVEAALEPVVTRSLKGLDPLLHELRESPFFRQADSNSRYHLFAVPAALWHRVFVESDPASGPPDRF